MNIILPEQDVFNQILGGIFNTLHSLKEFAHIRSGFYLNYANETVSLGMEENIH